jgi:hypothetical protein
VNVRLEGKWLIGGGVGAIIVIVLAIAAWKDKSIDIPLVSEGGSAAKAHAGSSPVAEEPEGPDLQHCVDLWNKSFNAGSMSELVALVPSYVSVTTSDLYPGKCLVTGANPELNLAAQFLEGGSGPDAYSQIGSGEANSLPASVTNWNASSDGEGHLTLKP